LLRNQVINRTRLTRHRHAAVRRPYKRKGQSTHVALAFDNVVGSGFGFDGGEGEGEIQPAEFRLHAWDILFQQSGELRQLLPHPVARDIELPRRAHFIRRPNLRFEISDGLLALCNRLQDGCGRRGARLGGGSLRALSSHPLRLS
jgi:hypothetical protein